MYGWKKHLWLLTLSQKLVGYALSASYHHSKNNNKSHASQQDYIIYNLSGGSTSSYIPQTQ